MQLKTEIVLYLSCFLPLKMHSSNPFSALPLISVTFDKSFRPNLLTSVAHSTCIDLYIRLIQTLWRWIPKSAFKILISTPPCLSFLFFKFYKSLTYIAGIFEGIN